MSQLLESEAISQLLNNINIEKKDNIKGKNDKGKLKNEKNCCIAAVKYNTIGNAYKDIQNNISVYLILEKKNDLTKTYAYSRCSKTTHDGNNFCHLHSRMTKYNNDGLKIFEKDILPKELNDKTRWLAHINDDFFENMGKRGAKKKNSENTYTFSESSNPILLILNHKNPKLLTQLSIYAYQLLKGNYTILQNDLYNSKLSQDNSKNKIDNNVPNLNDIISMISSMDNKNINKLLKKNNSLKNKLDNDESSSEEVLSEEDDNFKKYTKKDKLYNKSLNTKYENKSSKSIKNDDDEKSINYQEDSEDSEEEINQNTSIKDDESIYQKSDDEKEESDGISCIPIYTLKKRMLWYDPESNTVYEPEGDDGGAEMGILKEISSEHHTVLYKDKYYSVLKELNDKKHSKIFCCVLTDKLFNKKLEHIGNKKKLKNNEYQLNFFNEI